MMRRPTVEDVARLAGVSLMTVSRVINDAPRVASSTRARVEEAIATLGFVPNRVARSLRSRRSHWIACLMQMSEAQADPAGYSYLAALQAGVIARCRLQRHHAAFPVLPPLVGDPVEVARDLVHRHAPDGVLLVPPLADDLELIEALTAQGLAVVRIAPSSRDASPAPCVLMDDRLAAFEMTQWLIARGHRRIGFIEGHPAHVSSAHRLAGFHEALDAHGLSARSADIVPGRYTAESGRAAARALLARDSRPSAIFAANDDMAAGCLATARELGIDVPGELAVVGFDDAYVAPMLSPALTTVRQPIGEMGDEAARLLLERLSGREVPACVELPHRIVVRESAPAEVLTPLSAAS